MTGFTRIAAAILEEYATSGISSVQNEYQFYTDHASDQANDTRVHMWPLNDREVDDEENQLCRGDLKKSADEKSKLRCFLSDTFIPLVKGKAEEINLDPPIMVFHNVISNNEIEMLKEEGTKDHYETVNETTVTVGVPFEKNEFKFSSLKTTDTKGLSVGHFERSGLQLYGNDVQDDDDARVSYTGWVNNRNPILKKISLRIQLISGLDTTERDELSSAEMFQVVNYGIGGYFNTHVDNMYCPIWGPVCPEDVQELRGSGDRLATWMFYMNGVKAGGATYFPAIKARIPVTKGSAAFWYNILPNGKLDPRVQHGGCPVLLGSKWVCNKWIRETGQMFRRPCKLQENATK